MRNYPYHVLACIYGILLMQLCGCRVIEQSSQHGFVSGRYTQSADSSDTKHVYLDITEESATIYNMSGDEVGAPVRIISLQHADSTYDKPLLFHKTSLDIDITSILLKYRPATNLLPAQLSTDLNVAIYTGWRHDHYRITQNKDALGRNHPKIVTRGYDFGMLAGTGSTAINSSTTNNHVSLEYNGMILQFGIAAFIETNFASFGLASGFDHLLSSDRKNWIYNQKPWLGFVVGIALN